MPAGGCPSREAVSCPFFILNCQFPAVNSLEYLGSLNHHVFNRSVVPVRLYERHLLHDIQSLDYFPEDGYGAVQVRCSPDGLIYFPVFLWDNYAR